MSNQPTPLKQRIFSNPVFRSFLIFSIFRAFYGAGILVVTWFLATSEGAPWWIPIIFFLCSMVFSRIIFKKIKLRWPHLFETSQDPVV